MIDREPPQGGAPTGARRWGYVIAGVIVVAAIGASIAIITSSGDEVADPLFSRSSGEFDDVGTNGEAYRSVEDVTSAMKAGGITCSSLEEREPDSTETERAQCVVGNDDVIISTFETLSARNQHLESSRAFLDEADLGASSLPSVAGPTWVLTTDSKATAGKLQEALGGETLQ